jgi:hypothetical protein
VAVVAGTARAQTGDPSAIADRLFQEGRALEQQERWEEARARFEDSLRYEPAFGTRLNLAVCQEHLGRLATAWRLYLELHEIAVRARDVERRDLTQRYAKAIEPRVPRLVVVAPAAPPAGFAMTLDGALIAASGAVLRVDAGPHRIEAAAPGFEPVLRTAWLDDNDTRTVVLPALLQTAAHTAAPAYGSVQLPSYAGPLPSRWWTTKYPASVRQPMMSSVPPAPVWTRVPSTKMFLPVPNVVSSHRAVVEPASLLVHCGRTSPVHWKYSFPNTGPPVPLPRKISLPS